MHRGSCGKKVALTLTALKSTGPSSCTSSWTNRWAKGEHMFTCCHDLSTGAHLVYVNQVKAWHLEFKILLKAWVCSLTMAGDARKSHCFLLSTLRRGTEIPCPASPEAVEGAACVENGSPSSAEYSERESCSSHWKMWVLRLHFQKTTCCPDNLNVSKQKNLFVFVRHQYTWSSREMEGLAMAFIHLKIFIQLLLFVGSPLVWMTAVVVHKFCLQ